VGGKEKKEMRDQHGKNKRGAGTERRCDDQVGKVSAEQEKYAILPP